MERRRSYNSEVGVCDQVIVPLLRRTIEDAIQQNVTPNTRSVLDAGCGEQPFRSWFEQRSVGYISYDVAQNSSATVDEIGFLDRDLPPSLVARGPFDLILCTEVLEHVADWHTAFRNLASLLSPDGRCIITCPHVYRLHEEPYDYWRATSHALRHYAEKSGLEVISLKQLGSPADTLASFLLAIGFQARTRSPFSRFLVSVCRVLKRGVVKALRSKRFGGYVTIASNGPVYLSNLLVVKSKSLDR